jgi:hypothetical protein
MPAVAQVVQSPQATPQKPAPTAPTKPAQPQPAQPQQPGGTAGNFYGNDYMQCLQVARYRSQFVHESMREQAIGELLNDCMFARGHVQYAPIDGRSDNSDVENLLLFHSY